MDMQCKESTVVVCRLQKCCGTINLFVKPVGNEPPRCFGRERGEVQVGPVLRVLGVDLVRHSVDQLPVPGLVPVRGVLQGAQKCPGAPASELLL